MMTPEEIHNALVTLGDAIRANPCSFSNLPPEAQGIVLQLLTPMPSGWSDLQMQWVPKWWLDATQEGTAAANAALAAHGPMRISARAGYLPASLIADAGTVYAPIGDWLRSLVLRYEEDIVWGVKP